MITPPIAAGSTWQDSVNPDKSDIRSWGGWVESNVFSGAVSVRTSNYTVIATDRTDLQRCTSALTISITAAATLGNGFAFFVQADGGDVVIDPDGAETVNGSATVTVPDGKFMTIYCDGSGFFGSFSDGEILDAAAQRTTLGLGDLATQDTVSNGPAVITAAGSANYSFTSIPAGVNEFKLSLDGVSLSGSNNLMIRLGPAAGLATTGYVCSTSVPGQSAQSTGGFIVYLSNATLGVSGVLTFVRFEGTNKWSVSGGFVRGGDAGVTAGSVTLSGELSQVQVLASSSDNVDAGQIGLRYII